MTQPMHSYSVWGHRCTKAGVVMTGTHPVVTKTDEMIKVQKWGRVICPAPKSLQLVGGRGLFM